MPDLLKQKSKSSQPLPNSLHSCMRVKTVTINCYCLLNQKINRTTIVIAFNISGEPRIDSLLWRERFEICWPWYRREQDGNYWTGEWVSYLFVILTASVKTVWTISYKLLVVEWHVGTIFSCLNSQDNFGEYSNSTCVLQWMKIQSRLGKVLHFAKTVYVFDYVGQMCFFSKRS